MITISKINRLLRQGYSKNEVKKLIMEISEISKEEYEAIIKDFNYDPKVGEYVFNPKSFTFNTKIDLNPLDNVTKIFRVNKNILEIFEDFCERNPQHKKVDLTSMALIEYVNNHTEA